MSRKAGLETKDLEGDPGVAKDYRLVFILPISLSDGDGKDRRVYCFFETKYGILGGQIGVNSELIEGTVLFNIARLIWIVRSL